MDSCRCPQPDPGRDGFCKKCIGRIAADAPTEVVPQVGPDADTRTTVSATARLSSLLRSPEDSGRLSGINEIVRRMWWWIIAQGVAIGVWAGFAFPSTREACDYYSGCASVPGFGWGAFFGGLLAGIGAFGPLVFVVQALREVVRSLGRD